MSDKKQRYGLLDLYRFLLCFWVLSCHDFFFLENTTGHFSVPELAPDFFFVISGYFLLHSMEKRKYEIVHIGIRNLLRSRIKPLFFSICFISVFNFVCTALFIREDVLHSLFLMFRYWWYVLYLLVAVVLFYCAYKLIKTKTGFILFLSVTVILMTALDYMLETGVIPFHMLNFSARTLGCMSAGMLISYIPKPKFKKFNYSIIIVAILIPVLFLLAYHDKTFFTCVLMIALFTALVYFTTSISFGGKFFDVLGQLATRMYLYMSFVTALYLLGLTNHRILFVINVSLASMDLVLYTYKQKYEAAKAKAVE
ncbi:MAG: hypothetical protein E7676_04955 [Ruminococcaceae bacterium]|nr:hypothetical protein [Oscillospiraceae bacterium]